MSVARAEDFGFVTARVRALKSFLLTSQDLDTLLQARDEREALQRLASMPRYAESIPGLAVRPSLERVEEALLTGHVQLVARVRSWTKGNSVQLLDFVNRRFGYENLKLVLTSLFAGIGPDEAARFLLPSAAYSREECLVMMRRGSVEEILPLIEEELQGPVAEAENSARALGTVLPLENAVDRFYFTKVWTIAQSLKSWDKLYATSLIGQEIDVLNMLTVIRAKSLRIPKERVQALLIAVRYRLKDELESAAEAPTLQEAIARLTQGKYAGVLARFTSRAPETFEVEMGLRRYLAEESLKVFASFPLHVGLILAYLNLKLYEISDVRSIIVGKTLGRSADAIRSSLITYGLAL
ncbi:MAG: V-type ATPase subunit [Candidatus Bathyarchaeia archaeon]